MKSPTIPSTSKTLVFKEQHFSPEWQTPGIVVTWAWEAWEYPCLGNHGYQEMVSTKTRMAWSAGTQGAFKCVLSVSPLRFL